ncbi:MAG: nucleotidyl transferase AbiEii/AbiGii toxin family protein [Desulfurococcales archaeon]|nr:nucleotidyl transferase AbiEii/AbiGii toxin family protein [Desulfurococcales archaeon]
MIDFNELRGRGYTVQWYLTDIAKYLALWGISQAAATHGFTYVLGGGTALNDLYFPRSRRRFSRDLDLYFLSVESSKFLKYVNACLKDSGYFREIDVVGEGVVVQGLTYEGVRRSNAVYRFRIALPPDVHAGLKLTDVLPYSVKGRAGFDEWYLRSKGGLPRIYQVEVTVFRGVRRNANPVEVIEYELPVIDMPCWMDLPPPYAVTVFSLEDLIANKVEAVISGLTAKGLLEGEVTGRRTVKVRDVYDLVVAFLHKLYDKDKLFASLDALNIDVKYAAKAIRLAMLQTIIDPNKHRELTEIVPSLKGDLPGWVSMVLEAYEGTMDLCGPTPEDYLARKAVLGEKVDIDEVISVFNISRPQATHVLSKLERYGFLTRPSRNRRSR